MRPVLALELSTDGILLHELSYDGVWRRIDSAALGDPFLPKRMANMRATARASQGRFFKNQIWLPEKQIHGIEVKLTADTPEDRQLEAEQIMAREPGFTGRDLVVQVGEEDANGNTKIAGIDRQIMVEAQRFATGYGFGSDGFTASSRIAGFYQQPYFDLAEPATIPIDFRKIGFFAAVGVGAAAIIAGGVWLFNSFDFATDPSVAIEATDARIFTAEEDPRAPIRPTNSTLVNAQTAPIKLTTDQNEGVLPATDNSVVSFTTQIGLSAMNSVTDIAEAPQTITAINPVTATNNLPEQIAAASIDALPAPETSGFTVLEAKLPTVQPPLSASEFTGGTTLATYETKLPENEFFITPRLTDVLPSEESTVVLSAQLGKLNDSLGLTQVRENNAAAGRLARTMELQQLLADVIQGRPDIVPILRGGVGISDVPVVAIAPVEPLDPDAEPDVLFTTIVSGLSVEQLQRIPPRVILNRPETLPVLRDGAEIGVTPEVVAVPEPAIETVDEATRIATLQALAPIVETGRPGVLPTLRDGIEIGAIPIVPEPEPEPLDPAAEAERIAALQALPPNLESGLPGVVPTLRDGLEIGAVPVVEPEPAEILDPEPEVVTEPLDRATEAARIARLQNIPANVLTEAPAVIPLPRREPEFPEVSEPVKLDPNQSDAERLRPLFRPETIEQIAVVNDPTTSEFTVRTTNAPVHRSASFSGKVEALQEAAIEAARTTPTFTDAPREVNLPTSASVAREATIENGINLSATSLIGVYGKPGAYRALLRERGGKYSMLVIGERINGWTVVAIDEDTVRIKKGSRTEVLRMPAEG